MDQYYDSLDEGLKPIVPYIFQIPKGSAMSLSCSDHSASRARNSELGTPVLKVSLVDL